MIKIFWITLFCTFLVGCGTENTAQDEKDIEQSTQNEIVMDNQQGIIPVDEDVAKFLYEAFLKNEISVWMESTYDENGVELSVMSDEDYEFINAKKEYTFLDVNGDGCEELIFRMTEDYSNILYILGVSDEELVAFDVKETHSKSMAHGIYDNGIVWWGQNYDGEEEVFYTYTSEGEARELVHFVKANEMADEENTFDYFYYDGNVEEKNYLYSYEEYVSFSSAYKGDEPEWQELDK